MIVTNSRINEVDRMSFPEFTGVRVMMLPIVLGDESSLPDDVLTRQWHEPVGELADMAIKRMPEVAGQVGYLTVDEAVVKPGLTHRRPGLHTDGYAEFDDDRILLGAWSVPVEPKPDEPTPQPHGPWAKRNGPWSSDAALGMLTASSVVGCEAYAQDFEGSSGSNGDCSHLVDQLDAGSRVVLEPGVVYGMDGDTVHRSLIHTELVARQFVRLSMPSDAAWYEGYTANPLGVMPTGPILPARTEFMQWGNQHL